LLESSLVFAANTKEELVVYSARKEELIKPIFDKFTQQTGIEVKFLSDDSPKLIARLESEGSASPADLLITVDVANLSVAKEKGLFQNISSNILEKNVPAIYRDKDQQWFGLSRRVRAIPCEGYQQEVVRCTTCEACQHIRCCRRGGQVRWGNGDECAYSGGWCIAIGRRKCWRSCSINQRISALSCARSGECSACPANGQFA
jgi:hypothetical protein